jgi:CRISPR-associated exonuclease Cas4
MHGSRDGTTDRRAGDEGAGLFAEEELLPISALQHVVFCERQFALIHLERAWAENVLTVDGRRLHQRVEEGGSESRTDVRLARGVSLRSLRVGLVGKADVVEFVRDDAQGAKIPGLGGRWRPQPVEYKRGGPKEHRADEVQVCAQGLCLEEMLGVAVPLGSLFYGRTRRRLEVHLDEALRQLVKETASRARAILAGGATPAVARAPKCDACSLLEVCRPEILRRSARGYLDRALADALGKRS